MRRIQTSLVIGCFFSLVLTACVRDTVHPSNPFGNPFDSVETSPGLASGRLGSSHPYASTSLYRSDGESSQLRNQAVVEGELRVRGEQGLSYEEVVKLYPSVKGSTRLGYERGVYVGPEAGSNPKGRRELSQVNSSASVKDPAPSQHVVRRAAVAVAKEKPIRALKTAQSHQPEPNGPKPFALRWPARGRIVHLTNDQTHKNGLTISLPVGTLVRAAEDGEVIYAGSDVKDYGSLVMIKHAHDYITIYGYNSALYVHKGQHVKRGQLITKSGMSAKAQAPILYFELRKKLEPKDPLKFLNSSV